MKAHQDDAESKVYAAFELLDSDTQVSVTYFGAERLNSDDPVTCEDEITIEDPFMAGDGVPQFPSLGGLNGKTSIGNALVAALEHGGETAKLILITDGIEECNSDFSNLRRQYPRPSIDVIQVGDTPNTALNLLEVFPRDVVRTQALSIPLPIKIVSEGSEPDERDGIYLYIEKWFWFFGFVFLAGSAAVFGRIDSNRSVDLEIKTKEAQSFQELIRQGDGEAEKDLETLINDVDAETKKDEARRKRWFRYLTRKFWIADIGFLMLIGLAMAPPVSFGEGLDFGAAQDAAWTVLNSDFATAFALTWIVLLFYAATQNQRLTEARKVFAIATKEAERTANAQRTETRQDGFAEYERRFQAVGELIAGFQQSPPFAISQLINDEEEFVSTDLQLVCSRMSDLALRKKLSPSKTDADDTKLTEETERLTFFERGSRMWSTTPDLRMLIHRMNEKSAFGDNEDAWMSFASSFSQSDFDRIRSGMRSLAILIAESS